MTDPLPIAPEPDTSDSAKRRQIIEGARAVFLAQGFDAASMGEIARKAGVSKGTLYVYFKSKEDLFEAIVEEQSGMQAESIFKLDSDNHDVAAVLTQLGQSFVRFMCSRSVSQIRTVIAISDRMPEIGRRFYENGPERGKRTLQRYLDAQVAAGVLEVEDTELAAAHFLENCVSVSFKPMLFNFAPAPPGERIDYIVGISVRAFMRAYGKR